LFLLGASIAGWAQDVPSTAEGQAQQEPPQEKSARRFPVEVAGYVNFRYLNDDALSEHHFYPESSASLFLSKTIGRWRFHTEFNANTAPEYDSEGIHLFPARPSLSRSS
jgi:hypothetical protein